MAGESKQPQIAVAEAIHMLQMFRGADLTQTIYQIEKSLKGASAESYSTVLTASGAKAEVLGAAGLVKQLAGQINVVIHALSWVWWKRSMATSRRCYGVDGVTAI